MGVKYLLDSNTLIDFWGGKLPRSASLFLATLPVEISIVTKMEIIGRYGISRNELKIFNSFIAKAKVYQLDDEIVEMTIKLRQKYKVKLPDAIIAATAYVNKFVLITHNLSDFSPIKEINVVDSYSVTK